MRDQDKKVFMVWGVFYFAMAMAVIIVPRWIVLFVMCLLGGVSVGLLGIWKGIKDTTLPNLRRVSFVVLGAGYVIGSAIIVARISVKAQQMGWLATFR